MVLTWLSFLRVTKESVLTALIRHGKVYKLADFKYCVTTHSGTMAKELRHGFKQAGTVVLQLKLFLEPSDGNRYSALVVA